MLLTHNCTCGVGLHPLSGLIGRPSARQIEFGTDMVATGSGHPRKCRLGKCVPRSVSESWHLASHGLTALMSPLRPRSPRLTACSKIGDGRARSMCEARASAHLLLSGQENQRLIRTRREPAWGSETCLAMPGSPNACDGPTYRGRRCPGNASPFERALAFAPKPAQSGRRHPESFTF